MSQPSTGRVPLSAEALAGLFAALDIAVLAERDDGSFAPLGVTPVWFRDFCPAGAAEAPVRLEECFLFLEHFLVDARAFWSWRTPGRERSGPWTESDPRGVERHMEAAALFHAEQNILLIELLGGEYEQKQGVYQKARERAVEFRKLERVHEALRARQTETAELLDSTLDTTFRIDRQGRYWDARDIGLNRGSEADRRQPRRVSDVFPAEIAEVLMDSLHRALEAGGAQVTEYEAPGSDPRQDLEARIVPCGAGEVLVAVHDITERKQNEEQLREMLAQMRGSRDDLLVILNQLDIGAALTDEQGRIEFLSRTAAGLLGVAEEPIQGTSWDEIPLLSRAQSDGLQAVSAQPLQRRHRVSLRGERPDGTVFALDADIRDDPRDPARRLVFFYDVSEIQDLRRLLSEKDQFEELIGKSGGMQRVFQSIEDLAQVDATVLIAGEAGSGKELVARALHRRSRRVDKPFVAVNCAELTDSLAPSQLFGHKRGAFTGAAEQHRGLFEAAHSGVLFLDEIGDLPVAIQTSFLRVLQEREIRRLGETKTRKVDVRVVAATHRDLPEEVKRGNFRQDLLYRIRVGRVWLPPLRERREDIPLLANRFLGDLRAATGKPVREVSPESMRLLMDYPWPGNVRELRNALEYAVVGCRRAVIHPDDLPPETLTVADPPAVGARSVPSDPDTERSRFHEALNQAGGNRTRAARLLGVSRATFYRRLDALNIDPDPGG